jgi:hypothetical protein
MPGQMGDALPPISLGTPPASRAHAVIPSTIATEAPATDVNLSAYALHAACTGRARLAPRTECRAHALQTPSRHARRPLQRLNAASRTLTARLTARNLGEFTSWTALADAVRAPSACTHEETTMSTPRKIPPTLPLDDTETEVFFTRSALKADPDAKDLLAMTDGWLALVDAARKKERAAREAHADADAARIVANARLDRACERFGDELYLTVDKDRASARWTAFFSVTVSKFVRQALGKQVGRVRGWLSSNDGVLEKHRDELDAWSKSAEAALQQTAAVATVRGEARIAREQLAEDLTRERDGLHDALSARGREKRLPRDWADQFFRKLGRTDAGAEAETEPGDQDGG